jgi:hypothetical protein
MAILLPARRFKSVDLPTFWRPTMATIGLVIFYKPYPLDKGRGEWS